METLLPTQADGNASSAIQVRVGTGEDLAWVELRGELDLSGRACLEQALERAERGRPALLVLDLRGLELIDSTGLALLLAAERRATEAGRRLVLIEGTPLVQRTLRITGLDGAFELTGDPSSLPKPPL